MTIALVILAGVVIKQIARRRVEADRSLSSTSLAVGLMVVSTLAYFVLAIAGGMILTVVPGA